MSLTVEMILLFVRLRLDVHRDSVKLQLEALDLLLQVLNGVDASLLLELGHALVDHEVNLLRLVVGLLPADLDWLGAFLARDCRLVVLQTHLFVNLSASLLHLVNDSRVRFAYVLRDCLPRS